MITNNYQNQVNYGAVKDIVPQKVGEKLPQNIQNYDIKERVEDNPAVKAAQNANTDPLTIGLTGAIWLGFAQFCQHLNNRLNCNWENSWLGKVGSFAEKMGKRLPKNNGKITNFINNLFDKSAILRSLKTPTRPQNTMAISQARGISGYVMSDITSMLGYHLKNGHGDDIVKLLDGITDINGKTGSEALEFIENLFKNCEQNQTQIQRLIKNMANAPDTKVCVDYLVNANPKIPFTNIGFRLKIPNIPFLKRKGSFKEMANKLNAVFENSAGLGREVTKLGKTLPKQALKTLEGLTNGGAGGKLLIVIQASIFAQAIKKAMEAPKGEKLSTFMENIANDFGFFLSLPLQVKTSHILGGLKYIGIGNSENLKTQTENVKRYRSMIKELNEQVVNGTISHIEYLKKSKEIKKFLNGNAKWYQKPLKLLGRIFSTGLNEETIKPFINNADKSFGTGIFKKITELTNKIKGPGLGTIIRFAIGTMLVGPFIAKGVTKISHFIFGKPTKSVLDEEKKENKTQNNSNFNMTQEEMMQKLAAHPELVRKMENDPQFLNQLLENPELMVKYLNGELKVEDTQQKNMPEGVNSKYIIQNNTSKQMPNNSYQPQAQQSLSTLNNNTQSKMDLFGLGKKEQDTQKEETEQQQNSLEPVRTYIPSSECMIKADSQEQDLNSEVNSALLKAQKAEEAALKQLSSL